MGTTKWRYGLITTVNRLYSFKEGTYSMFYMCHNWLTVDKSINYDDKMCTVWVTSKVAILFFTCTVCC